ncbi:MAG: biotin synthase BioB [Gammaproteobacteria bacterium]|nr:biotin synthase BioB [Gammaproteobacteria bacterium]
MRPETADIAAPVLSQIEALFELPFSDLIYRAQTVHRRYFDPNAVQLSTLLSIKTGGCSEDCGYCSQSARFPTDVENQPLMPLEEVIASARAAKERGATRFCMGAAWRGPKERDLAQVTEMVRAVKALGMETCATLGQLRDGQAEQLAQAGLDYYNHNLDTSRAHYDNIVHTHSYDDRLGTLEKVRHAGMKVCCGGIMGMGESREDRVQFLAELAALDPPPESVPINLLVRVPGTPLAISDQPALDPIEFVRTIAVARIAMPASFVRLSAGRGQMPDYLQALCFLAGANSIFYGDRLLTTPNPESDADLMLFEKLGIHPMSPEIPAPARKTAEA